jgi:predicted metal-dependent phosphotriesterase family hydrolase
MYWKATSISHRIDWGRRRYVCLRKVRQERGSLGFQFVLTDTLVELLEDGVREVRLHSMPIFQRVDGYPLHFFARFVHDGGRY